MATTADHKNIKSCWHHLSLLARSHQKNPKNRALLKQALLLDGGDCLTSSISDIVFNLLRGNCPLDDATKRLLRRHRSLLLQLANSKASLKRKRKLLINQKGSGFLAALLGAALPILVDLIFPKSPLETSNG